jgi:predicted heme/steroid binding protein
MAMATLLLALLAAAGCQSAPVPTVPAPERTSVPAPAVPSAGSQSVEAPDAAPGDQQQLRVFTLQELRAYDGREGRRAYVAVDGAVYDVTHVAKWIEGHHVNHQAGGDFSELILESPHGKAILRTVPVAGRLAP